MWDFVNDTRSGLDTLALAMPLIAALNHGASCPDYSTYSLTPHGNPSLGLLGLPYMRPDPACRTFNSTSVEKVILDMTARLKDPDIARLFENTFPNTLDTTVKYFNKAGCYVQDDNLAFIITGDISAQWLRDTGNQFAQYRHLLSIDPELAALVKAVINNEARYISQYPYCGAFQPPPESGLPPTHNSWADGVVVNPPADNQTVFECKASYELDSLCGFIKLSVSYYQATKDPSMMNTNCESFYSFCQEWIDAHPHTGLSAIDQIFRVMNEQSQPSYGASFDFISYYNWTGLPGSLSGPVNNGGNGEPKSFTGMVGTSHRPSDDLSVYAFLTPANAMLSVEMNNLATILDEVDIAPSVSAKAEQWSQSIKDAIYEHAVRFDVRIQLILLDALTQAINNVFAYETNGLGSVYMMDDANVPSLLSLPYLGFLDRNDSTYLKTKKMLMSRWNPYYASGQNFSGIGGPHIEAWHPWPMSQISNIFGSDDDDEIQRSLYMIVNNTAGLGLIHESINIYNGSDYTRSWFAWANSYFSEMILDLAQRKPHLLFETTEPYIPGQ
ncbi:Six-hairpin glycosidase-like protein [Chiua virens]|nr:Six-hairpin glycosidase-like protein [Chiua virens]